MILNSFAVLTVFVALLRLLMSMLVVALAIFGWRRFRGAQNPEARSGHEKASSLVLLLAVTLVLLSLVSWPLLYLLLQSYVSEWPGVMCIYGVTQVGQGSFGPARYLPAIVMMVQVLKPVVVFVGGAWYILHLLNRRSRSAPLTGRVFATLLPLGFLAFADAAVDLAYVGITKKEEFPDSGCCTATGATAAERFLPQAVLGEDGWPWLYAAYFGTNSLVMMALGLYLKRGPAHPGRLVLAGLSAVAAANLAASAIFLVEVIAPTLLNLPHHHCAYDLIPDVPEGVVAIGLFLGATFSVGWAASASWLGRSAATDPLLSALVRDLLRFSLWGYLTSLVMVLFAMAVS